jgi:hypothetical protein
MYQQRVEGVTEETNRKCLISRNYNRINIELKGRGELKCCQEQVMRQEVNKQLHYVVLNV